MPLQLKGESGGQETTVEGLLATVEYGSSIKPQTKSVSTVEELDAFLDKLTEESPNDAPYLVTVIRRNGDCLTIGLGSPILVNADGEPLKERFEQPLTVLGFDLGDGNPPYYTSKGLGPASHNFVFYFGGHWTEFTPEQAIGVAIARQAVREFVATNELPSCVEWNEV